ncbi:hypothetical protein C2845_PM04G32310 [Panicum miliaceum]|uniref:Phorbol-ester/DAG-type domain-containing protein n=1 Tax=Panicum miliaceum TaxID=4540 RepID=A0A3L6QLF3_PANMI|nr:hypothetical protein C2845_PM04G32310 [Panicum miliaceum]
MAPSHRRHYFAHPQHPLLRTQYGGDSTHVCDICRSQLAGLAGYRCNACDIDVHEACAGYFKEAVAFFAHPWHSLTLSRIPAAGAGWACDLCEEECAPGSFVYLCARCMFDVHPLWTMLPQTIRSALHPEHDLCMVPSSGHCSACNGDLPVGQYVCGGDCLISSSARVIARFLLKASFRVAVDAANGDLASPVLNVLEAAFS